MRYIVSFTACVLIFVSFIGFMPLNGEGELYENIIRLHVIANSDSEEDQALKLAVRDEILSRYGTAMSGSSFEDAKASIESSLSGIESAAAQVILENGYTYDVHAMLSEEYYPERSYEGFILPAGDYTSLRVTIGEAAGKNWWCVLFPPLCVSAAIDDADGSQAAEDKFISAGFTPEQYKIITESESPKYRLKFKIVEMFEEMFGSKNSNKNSK